MNEKRTWKFRLKKPIEITFWDEDFSKGGDDSVEEARQTLRNLTAEDAWRVLAEDIELDPQYFEMENENPPVEEGELE